MGYVFLIVGLLILAGTAGSADLNSTMAIMEIIVYSFVGLAAMATGAMLLSDKN